MSILKDKIISSMSDILNQSLQLVKSDNRLHILNTMFDVLTSINKLSVQSGCKYTYDYSILYLHILEFIKNCSGEINSEDMKLIELYAKNLHSIFGSENANTMDNVKYDYICKNSNLDLKKYFVESSIDDIVFHEHRGFFQDKVTLPLSMFLGKYTQHIKEKYSFDIKMNCNDIKIQTSIMAKLQNILNEFAIFIFSMQNINSNILIEFYETNGSLQINIMLDNLNIDFGYVLKRLIGLNILREEDIPNMTEISIFDILISEEYFDGDELFLPLKRIKMQLDLLLGNISYRNNQNLCLSIPCDFVTHGFCVDIEENTYFVPNSYMQEVVSLSDALIEQNMLILASENINIISNEILKIKNGSSDDFLIIINHKGEKFAFYCNNLYKSPDVEISSISKNLSSKYDTHYILGLCKQEGDAVLLALDMLKIKNKL